MVECSLLIHCLNMFVCLLSRHVFSLWLFLGAVSFPTIRLILQMSSVTQAQVYYTTGNTIQIPNFLLPTTITVNIPQSPPQPPPAQSTTARPAAPLGPVPSAPGAPPSTPGAVPGALPAFGVPATFRPLAPAPTPAPGPAPAPQQQPQTVSVSITQPQQVSTAVDSCLGMGCFPLIPLAPAQSVVYTQPLYSLWGWRNWAIGWRTGWSGCSLFC